jgi:diacylglycerol kinase family enzyme
VLRIANLGLLKHAVVTLLKWERPEKVVLVKHWQGKEISVFARPRHTVQCDGEVLREGSLHIKVIPHAINVVVPGGKNNVGE